MEILRKNIKLFSNISFQFSINFVFDVYSFNQPEINLGVMK